MSHCTGQCPDIALIQFNESTPFEPARQKHGAVANPYETTHGMAYRFKHATDFAVPSLGNGDLIPAVGSLAAARLNRTELRHAIIECYSFEQALLFIIRQGTQHPDRIFALQSKPRMHQLVGQLPGTCQEKQAFSIEVKSPDGLPFSLKQFWQPPEYGWPVLRIVVRHDFSGGLVVSNDAWWRRVDAHPNGFTIDLHGIAELDALSNMSGFGVDRNTPLKNQLLHFQSGAKPGLCKYLVQFGSFRQRRQHPLWQPDRHIIFVSVELTRHHVFKPDGTQRRHGSTPFDRSRQTRSIAACLAF